MPKTRQQTNKPTRKVVAQYIASAVVALVVMLASTQLGIDITAEDLAGLEAIIVAVITAIGLPSIPAVVTYFIRPSKDDGVVEEPY